MLCVALVFALFPGITNLSAAPDTLHVRVIWMENGRLYLNAGAEQGVSVGWQFRIPEWDSSHPGTYQGVLDRVYLDLSSGPAGPLAALTMSALSTLPDAEIYSSQAGAFSVPHIRVGIVTGDQSLRVPEDVADVPFLASLFYPWTRSGDHGELGTLTPLGGSSDFDGRRWQLAIDTACRPGGEFPGGWGALADRLQGIIREHDNLGCLTIWALRPAKDRVLSRMGVYFEGFSQVDDTALGFNFATPFYTLPEYVNSGALRREVAAAVRFEPELTTVPLLWQKIGDHTWVRRAQPCTHKSLRFAADTITVRSFDTSEDQRLSLELGDIDLAVISVEDCLHLQEGGSDIRVLGQLQDALVIFGVNQQKKDLADNRLTAAVSYLTDKPALVRALLADRAAVAHTVFGEERLPGGEPFYGFDPRKGRQMLKELGLRRTLNFYVDRRIDRGMAVAEHIAAKLADGGIRTRLVPADRQAFADPAYRDSMDIVLYWWPVDSHTPDAALYQFLYPRCVHCGTNPLVLDNPRLVKLVEQARQEHDPAVRRRSYDDVEYDLLAQPFICPLYRPMMTIAARPSIPGVRLTGAGEIDIVSGEESTAAGKAVQ